MTRQRKRIIRVTETVIAETPAAAVRALYADVASRDNHIVRRGTAEVRVEGEMIHKMPVEPSAAWGHRGAALPHVYNRCPDCRGTKAILNHPRMTRQGLVRDADCPECLASWKTCDNGRDEDA